MTDADKEPAALAGIRIVDLTEGLAGPAATRMLAEVGADVLKVEPPEGDLMRREAPATFATWNRSKRSITLDVFSPVGRARLDEVLAAADVVVHGLTPARARAAALDPESLAARFPSLIVTSVTGYPPGHPDEERAGREILVQARLGAMDEQQALRPGPMFVRMPFANWGAAYLLAGGIVTRLLERRRSGRARALHTSLLQGALVPAALYWQRAQSPPLWMSRHALRRDDHPSNLTIFRCADGEWIHMLGGFTGAEPMRQTLAELGCGHLAGTEVTLANRDEWALVFATRPVQGWTDLLWPAGVICMPVLEVGEVLALDQACANDYSVRVDDERFGTSWQAGFPFEAQPPAAVRSSAPWSTEDGHIAGIEPRLRETGVAAGNDAPAGLRGLRVVDFGAYVAGPVGAQCMADFGADVIKVEPPWGERGRTLNQFSGSQRGKRCLALDLRHPAAAEVVRRLIVSADVVTHNVRTSAARRLGIDEASVRAVNPHAVLAHGGAHGPAGPWAEFGAFDPAACALSGWEHGISGPGNRPTWLRNSAMDAFTGVSLFVASAVALYRREVTGRTGRVGTSLLATACMTSGEVVLGADGQPRDGFRPVDPQQCGVSPYYRIYETAEGWLAVAAIGEQERADMDAVLAPAGPDEFGSVLLRRSAADLVAEFDKAGVPAEIVARGNRDAFFDRELAAGSGLVRRDTTLAYGWFENPAGFWSEDTGVVRAARSVPAIGEHTVEILGELGFSGAEIDALLADGAVSDREREPPSDRTPNQITRSLAARR